MKKTLYTILIIFTLISLFACKKKEDGKVVAEVKGTTLYEREFRSRFSEKEWSNLSEVKRNEAIYDWVEITLLSQEAIKRGLEKLPEVKFNIKYAKNTILANELLSQELEDINITEGEIFAYYNLNRNNFLKEVTTFQIQSFIVPNWTIADSVISLFNDGEAFYTAAKNYGRNYKVHFIQKNDVNASFWNYIQTKMKKWNIRVIRDGKDLKVVQLLKIDKEDVPINFSVLKDSLKTKLLEEKQKNLLHNSLDSLKIDYNVTIY